MEKTIENSEKILYQITVEHKEKFEAFRAYLLEYNKKYNLTAITEEKDMLYKHFFDSLAGKTFLRQNSKVAEIGSGAGFPSIPLKIVRDDLSFYLFESVGKKCDFLHVIVDNLGLQNVYIYNMRAEDAARQVIHREKYDYVLARAVAAMNTLAEYCMPFIKVGGEFIAYKSGDVTEIQGAEKALKILGGQKAEIYPYSLPENYGERVVAAVKKVKNTPDKYPRGNGKERKNPL